MKDAGEEEAEEEQGGGILLFLPLPLTLPPLTEARLPGWRAPRPRSCRPQDG